MKIAVTGGNGQLGRHVVAGLEPDYEITVLDKTGEGERQPLGPVDLLDLDKVKMALTGRDAVIHLGGLDAAIDASPEQFYHTNTMATWNVLHAGCEVGVRTFSLCSSSSAYGFSREGQRSAPDYLPIDESHPLRASDAYGLSKRVVEEIGHGFVERKDVSLSILRPCYIAFDHLLPRMVRCKLDQPEPETGQWQEPMPAFRWVIDPMDLASCFRLAIEATPSFEVFNVSADDTFSAAPTREHVESVFGQAIPEKKPGWFDSNPFATPLDCSKAKTLLGWKPCSSWGELRARAGDV